MRSKRPARRESGSSLMEALVAMALAFLMMIGAAEALVLALRIHKRAASLLDMTDLAGARLEALRAEASPVGIAPADGSDTAPGRSGRLFFIRWNRRPEPASPVGLDLLVSPVEAPEKAVTFPLFFNRVLGF